MKVTHGDRQRKRREKIEAAEFLEALQNGDPVMDVNITDAMLQRDEEIFRDIEKDMEDELYATETGTLEGTSEGGD